MKQSKTKPITEYKPFYNGHAHNHTAELEYAYEIVGNYLRKHSPDGDDPPNEADVWENWLILQRHLQSLIEVGI